MKGASVVYAARCAGLPIARGTGVRVGAIFDVRALLTPPLEAELIVRLSTRMGFRAEALASMKTRLLDRERAIFGQSSLRASTLLIRRSPLRLHESSRSR